MQKSQAYDIIVELQKNLHSEFATSASLDEALNQESAEKFSQFFLDQLTIDKQYYLQIFFMNYFKKKKELPFTNPVALLSHNLEKELEEIPIIFSTSEEVEFNFLSTVTYLVKAGVITSDLKSEKTPESKIFTDFITYSIIPSLYLMFIERDSFDLFCKFIDSLKKSLKNNEIIYTLSRSLFVSPMFTKFIHKILCQCLKPFYENTFAEDSDKNIKSLQNKILESFSENLCFIPSYMIRFFKVLKDTSNFLRESLFSPMFENPEYYLVVDIPDTDFEDKMTNLKKILVSAFTDDFIDEIAKMIDSCNGTEKALFTSMEKSVFRKVINSVDKYVFSFIEQIVPQKENDDNNNNNNDPKIEPIDLFGSKSEYLLYGSLFKDEKEVKEEIYEQTQYERVDPWMYFRKLVKDSPPLPSKCPLPDANISDENDFLNLVKTILVDTNDPFTNIEANITYDLFVKSTESSSIPFTNDEEFKRITKNLVKTHPEQVIAMERMSRFNEELKSLIIKKERYIKMMGELYKTILTNSIKHPDGIPNANANPKLLFDILSDPISYRNSIEKYLHIQQEQSQILVGPDCLGVWYHRFFHSLNFSSYCAYRSDLRKLDEIAERNCKKFVEQASTNDFGSKPTLSAIKHIDMFTDKLLDLYQAFECNNDPLTKLNAINDAFINIIADFANNFGIDGEDDKTPFRSVILAFTNPPKIISNFVYILEYLMRIKIGSGNPQIDFVDYMKLAPYLGAISFISQIMKDETFDNNNTIYYYSRNHHFWLDIFITGFSSDSIDNLLKLLNNLSYNKFTGQELSKYKKKFHIPLRIKISQFECALANVYFGQNIKSKSLPEAHKADLKITLSQKFSLRGEYTELNIFDNNKGTDEKHIFYEKQDDISAKFVETIRDYLNKSLE